MVSWIAQHTVQTSVLNPLVVIDLAAVPSQPALPRAPPLSSQVTYIPPPRKRSGQGTDCRREHIQPGRPKSFVAEEGVDKSFPQVKHSITSGRRSPLSSSCVASEFIPILFLSIFCCCFLPSCFVLDCITSIYFAGRGHFSHVFFPIAAVLRLIRSLLCCCFFVGVLGVVIGVVVVYRCWDGDE